MKYSKNYSKLKKDEYTTIRRYSKGSIGKIVKEVYPGGTHFAKIMDIQRKPLILLSTLSLLADTDCNTREEAVSLINSFYRKPIDEYKEKLYIYYLKKI